MKPQYSNEKGMLIEGNFWMVHPQTGEAWDQTSVADFVENYQAPDNGPSLDDLKKAAVTEIKQQAAERIVALDWKLQRAGDRVSQAELGGESQLSALEQAETELLNVLNEREAIRVASNEAEVALLALEDADAVEQFSWAA
jgi:hypothetical protein